MSEHREILQNLKKVLEHHLEPHEDLKWAVQDSYLGEFEAIVWTQWQVNADLFIEQVMEPMKSWSQERLKDLESRLKPEKNGFFWKTIDREQREEWIHLRDYCFRYQTEEEFKIKKKLEDELEKLKKGLVEKMLPKRCKLEEWEVWNQWIGSVDPVKKMSTLPWFKNESLDAIIENAINKIKRSKRWKRRSQESQKKLSQELMNWQKRVAKKEINQELLYWEDRVEESSLLGEEEMKRWNRGKALLKVHIIKDNGAEYQLNKIREFSKKLIKWHQKGVGVKGLKEGEWGWAAWIDEHTAANHWKAIEEEYKIMIKKIRRRTKSDDEVNPVTEEWLDWVECLDLPLKGIVLERALKNLDEIHGIQYIKTIAPQESESGWKLKTQAMTVGARLFVGGSLKERGSCGQKAENIIINEVSLMQGYSQKEKWLRWLNLNKIDSWKIMGDRGLEWMTKGWGGLTGLEWVEILDEIKIREHLEWGQSRSNLAIHRYESMYETWLDSTVLKEASEVDELMLKIRIERPHIDWESQKIKYRNFEFKNNKFEVLLGDKEWDHWGREEQFRWIVAKIKDLVEIGWARWFYHQSDVWGDGLKSEEQKRRLIENQVECQENEDGIRKAWKGWGVQWSAIVKTEFEVRTILEQEMNLQWEEVKIAVKARLLKFKTNWIQEELKDQGIERIQNWEWTQQEMQTLREEIQRHWEWMILMEVVQQNESNDLPDGVEKWGEWVEGASKTEKEGIKRGLKTWLRLKREGDLEYAREAGMLAWMEREMLRNECLEVKDKTERESKQKRSGRL